MTLGKSSAICCALATLMLLGGCELPTYNPAKLKKIKAEARSLIASHPLKSPEMSAAIPPPQWPPTIAGLKPEFVTVHSWGVDIYTKPYFDGGWGYHVARNANDLPMPRPCYSELSEEVFWHGPC